MLSQCSWIFHHQSLNPNRAILKSIGEILCSQIRQQKEKKSCRTGMLSVTFHKLAHTLDLSAQSVLKWRGFPTNWHNSHFVTIDCTIRSCQLSLEMFLHKVTVDSVSWASVDASHQCSLHCVLPFKFTS